VGPGRPITPGSTLVIEGKRLRGAVTRLRIAGAELDAADAQEDRIAVPLAALPRDTLRAGVHQVQVVHPVPLGDPLTLHTGPASNVVTFVMRPTVRSAGSSGKGDARTLRVDLDPAIRPGQRVVVFLNEQDAPPRRPPRAYTLRAELPGDTPSHRLEVPVGTVESGRYLVRVHVDGATSMPTATEGEEGAEGPFLSPSVTL
jgi:hypothetical protein